MKTDTIKLLHIEDDQTDYQLIHRCLSIAPVDFDTAWAKSVNAGCQMLAAADFDVVLTDLSLPDSVGLETVRKIRQCDADVPIVVLTTLDDRGVEQQTLEVGAQDYLIKSEATAHTLQRAIDHARFRQQSVVENRRLLADFGAQAEVLAEQKKLLQNKNRRLRKLYKTAHKFVDNVSHEFRTPLTVIKDYVSLVREGMVGEVNDEQQRMLDIVGVRTDDLNNMVDDMLDVSKLEAGLLGAWRRNCRIADVIAEVRPALQKKAGVKEISFQIEVDDDLPEVYCDSEKMGRVIINLVTNAMKFCGEPGVVRLWSEADREQGEVVIGVTDNGTGIDADGLAKLFQRFKQLNTNVKSSTKGFGLGLNIAKELVDLNFGDIRVESRLNDGSTFSFSVPVADPVEVLRRYLNRVHALSNGTSHVSIIQATVDDAVSEGDAEDVDTFFNYLLRRNDLLFRCGPRVWLIIALAPRTELDHLLARAQKEWEKTNRNRPYGPLPEFRMDVTGTWCAETQSEAILSHFVAAMNPETALAT